MRVMFACNDYRNGSGQGWFDQIAICQHEIELDGPRTRMAFVSPGVVRIGRMKLKHRRWSEWVGNWCWDELDIVNTSKLLHYLRGRGFVCSTGPTRFYEVFNRKDSQCLKTA